MIENKKYDVFDGIGWKKVDENYVKDIRRKEEIDFIYDVGNETITVYYKDGKQAFYQNVHGCFVFQYYG